ncbi:transposable element Tcb2 transposase [Trichonephila clavipes]|nr:transposable element Tcb2 transposase [Trichonephila clavipes]
MPLHRFRRQYEQLPQFERGRIIDMMEVEGSAGRVACQLGRSDFVVRRYWDQWIREMLFTPRRGPGRPRKPSRQEDRCTVRNTRVQHNAIWAAIQAHVAPSLGLYVSSRTIRSHPAEGHLESRSSLRVLPLTPTHRCLRLEWSHARGNWTAMEWNQVVFSAESRYNLNNDENRVRVWIPVGRASFLPSPYSDTPLPQLV